MLRRNNFSLFTQGLSPTELPLTIQHAIYVAGALGIDYLWVDTLCIMQDDEDDKTHNISNMDSIYKHAELTLVAAASASVAEGLVYRLLESPRRCVMPFLNSAGELGTASIDRSPPAFNAKHPLDRRAWTFQETLLSPRKLIFSQCELLWQCRTCYVALAPVSRDLSCERGYHRLPSTVFGLAQEAKPSRLLKPNADAWFDMVADYSGRALSFPEDRLPAIAGVAQELGRAWYGGRSEDYLAGLWRADLAAGLAWFRDHATEPPPPPLPRPEAPSWSWVSLACQVRFKRLKAQVAVVKDCHVQPLIASAPFGRVVSGSLTLTARVVPLAGAAAALDPRKLHYDEDAGDQEDPSARVLALVGERYGYRDRPKVALILEQIGGEQAYRRRGLADDCDGDFWEAAVEKALEIR